MRLPGAEHAICDAAKVRDYLLSHEHPYGSSKARFFESLGFKRDEWHVLQAALLQIGQEGEAEMGRASAFGQKYVVRGTIRGPSAATAAILTAWILVTGEDQPRLVTAHPRSLR